MSIYARNSGLNNQQKYMVNQREEKDKKNKREFEDSINKAMNELKEETSEQIDKKSELFSIYENHVKSNGEEMIDEFYEELEKNEPNGYKDILTLMLDLEGNYSIVRRNIGEQEFGELDGTEIRILSIRITDDSRISAYSKGDLIEGISLALDSIR